MNAKRDTSYFLSIVIELWNHYLPCPAHSTMCSHKDHHDIALQSTAAQLLTLVTLFSRQNEMNFNYVITKCHSMQILLKSNYMKSRPPTSNIRTNDNHTNKMCLKQTKNIGYAIIIVIEH